MKIRLPGNPSYCLLTVCLLLMLLSAQSQGVYRFWGSTRQGGQHNTGVLFSLDSNAANYSVKFDFTLSNAGASPYYTQLTEWNGKFYGVTVAGGDNSNYGVIFEWDPVTNVYSHRYSFSGSDCWFMYGSLTVFNNKFYGMTSRGGDYGLGVLFEWDPVSHQFTRLYHFSDASGHSPEGSLTVKDGKLYGLTRAGGANFGGTLFSFDPLTLDFTLQYEFDYAEGKGPHGDLKLYNGKLYGMTAEGGPHGYGTLFEWDPDTGTFTNRFAFDGANGKYPYGSLTVFQDKLYGLTSEGGANNAGVLFEYNPAGFACMKKLDFGGSLGINPYGSLAAGDNTLAGCTWMGGTGNYGTLFEYNPATGQIVQTREFSQQLNGSNPLGSLAWNGASFFGLTSSGGAANAGVIFEWEPTANTYTKRIDFNIAENGALPTGSLLKWKGKLYGTASRGGMANRGVLFSYNEATGEYTRLVDFDGTNGAYPTGDLRIIGQKIYGWTREGGLNDKGAIFSWDLASQTLQVVYSFTNAEGSYPSAGALWHNDKFYGTTEYGGIGDYGVLYMFDPATSNYTVKHHFDGTGGANPTGYLAVRNQQLFGMTSYGGTNETGTIYQWDLVAENFTTRYHFEANGMGVHPRAGLTLSSDGSEFYGMTRETNGQISFPGQEGPGVLFAWNPQSGQYSKKIDFDGANGGLPVGNLRRSGGRYYGMTNQGGDGESYPGINYIVGGSGVIFEWDAANNIISKKVDLLGDNGAYPSGNDLALAEVPVAEGQANNCHNLPSVMIDAENNNKWVPIVDAAGNVLAEIMANGNNLGLVQASVYIHEGPQREDSKRRIYLNRSISISPANQPGTPVSIRLYIRSQEFEALKQASNSQGQPSGISQIGDLSIYKMPNDCGESFTELQNRLTSTAASWSADYVLSTQVSSFSTFYFAPGAAEAPLPVEFLSFTADLRGKDAELNWQTAHERDIVRFDIERSLDGITYSVVGNSNPSNQAGTHQYRYTDPRVTDLGVSRLYYRIRELDLDGRYTYSKEAVVNIPFGGEKISIYPNPVQTDAILRIQSNLQGPVQLRIYDARGVLVRQQTLNWQTGTTQHTLRLGDLAAGVYLLELRAGEWRHTLRIIRQ